ncbi:MAG: hypothetical protein RLZ51_1548 [Pseudomonadota bacterium]
MAITLGRHGRSGECAARRRSRPVAPENKALAPYACTGGSTDIRDLAEANTPGIPAPG